jgi:hypothetical protein
MNFVLRQTQSNRLQWIPGESGSFVASHSDMSLYISSEYDPDREVSSFWFRLNGSDGHSTPFSVYDFERDDYQLMRVLFEEIIFNANNAERDLERFMKGFN